MHIDLGGISETIAIVFRGDRGLELLSSKAPRIAVLLRSSFGAIEDWNLSRHLAPIQGTQLRSSFGAIEDWNPAPNPLTPQPSIAIVFRGDRGLEHD